MSSNLLSRFLPPQGSNSTIYDQIKEQENAANQLLDEDRETHDIDEQNLAEEYHDDDLDRLLREAAESQITSDGAVPGTESPRSYRHASSSSRAPSKARWMQGRRVGSNEADEDPFEPGNLLLEDREQDKNNISGGRDRLPSEIGLPTPVPGPSSRRSKVQWSNAKTQAQEFIDDGEAGMPRNIPQESYGPLGDRHEKALYRWATVENLDEFLHQIYNYYKDNGIWSTLLRRVLQQVILAFVVALTVFLGACVDYRKIPRSSALDQVIIPKCTQNMSALSNLSIWSIAFFWIFQSVQLVLDVPRLLRLHDFYYYVLGVADAEMQTISWPQIVKRLMALRESNPNTALNTSDRHRQWMSQQLSRPNKQRMDAHDIANRLMRKDNYFIALFNKDILDFSLPIAGLRNRQLFSQLLQWNINLSIGDYVFNERGEVSQLFLKDIQRRELVESLQRRFILIGFINLLAVPLLLIYTLLFFFLQYFTEYKNNPAQIGSRAYTALAQWKFREFNELPHLFQERMNMSYPFAKHYIDQFPKDKTIKLAKFVAFVAGALGGVLAIGSLLDPNSFLEFEITTDRTVLFYLGIFGAIWQVARGMVPDDYEIYDPEHAIQQVIYHTHYQPDNWKDRLHSEEVRQEFASLYQMKIVTFLEDIFGIVTTPFILMFSLPQCSERLIDFFREFTVHVDGLGYVCSFAVFDFKQGAGQEHRTTAKDGNETKRPAADIRDDYYSTKHGKMKDSMLSFKQAYLDPQFANLRPYADRAFQLPPKFPGVSHSAHLRGTSRSRDLGSQYLRSPTGRMKMSHASPAPSLHLDREHQLTMRKSRLMNQSKYRGDQGVLPEELEEEEDDGGPSASVMFEEEGRMDRRLQEMSAHDEDQLGEKGGVLGLLTKFTEVRGQAVNI